MSAISNPTPSPIPEPGKAPAPSVKRPARWKLLIIFGVVAAGAITAYELWLKPQKPAPSATAAAIRTAKVTADSMDRIERLAGITSSSNFVNIRMPRQRGGDRMSLILLDVLPSGQRVKEGDIVARIDGQSLTDHIDDVNSMAIVAEADIKKREAEQEVEWSNLQQSLRLSKATWDKWKLEAGAAEVRTVIDRELLDLGVEESEASYLEEQKDIKWQKAQNEADLQILDITHERHIRHRDRHVYDLRRYTVESPMGGMTVRQQIFRSGAMQLVEPGDQVYPGMLFLKVMDTDHMQVEASINQTESNLFRIGQEARIGLDAFPGVEFKGHIRSIGALAKSSRQSQYVRRIPLNIAIEGSDPRLLPDLSAYADVVLDRADTAKHIPLGAVHEEQGQAYVYVKDGQGFQKRPVQLGFENYTDVAVVSGLEVGEEVALDLPTS